METSGMGKLLLTAKTGMGQQLRRVFEMIATGAMAALMSYGVWNFLKDWQNPTTTTIVGVIMFAPFALGFLIGALILLWNFLYSFGHEITVYEGGIKHKYSGKAESWSWNELEALSYHSEKIRVNLYPLHNFKLKLRSKDKKTIHIDKIYTDYERLAGLLIELTRQAWTKRDFKVLQTGETLRYGNISLSKQGVSQGKKLIPWKEIEYIDRNKLNLNFKIVPYEEVRRLFNVGSKSIYGTLSNTWNGHILLNLIQTVMDAQRKRV